MQKLSPELFWEEFATYLRNKINSTPDWQSLYSSNKKWTLFMKKTLKSLGKSLGYTNKGEVACEYYKIDTSYYKYASKDRKYEDCDWDFEVAIEYENNPKTWFEEFIKLIHINCRLKVIITYHNYQNTSEAISLDSKLRIAEDLYQKRKYKQPNDNWLIIIGPTKEKLKEDFIAFKIENGKFIPLDEQKIIK